jgi:HlyD family secretion protein
MTMTSGQPETGNLNGKATPTEQEPTAAKPKRPPKPEPFEHPLMLQQSSIWSRAILWTLMGVATTAIAWACLAKIEEAIPAAGKLEPQGTVKDVQIPVNGVVRTVYIKDGQHVKQGDLLLRLDPTTAQAQLASLKQIRVSLQQENQFYQAQMQGKGTPQPMVQIPSQFLSLTKSRAALVAENQLFRAQLNGSTRGIALSSRQQERLQSNQMESDTRAAAARAQVEQLSRQLSQTQVKLIAARKTLSLNQKILQDVAPIARSGAISNVQYLKQQQEVESNQSDVDQLVQEQGRLRAAIAEAQSKVQNTLAVDRKDLTAQLEHNEQKIAEIDSQLTKAIVENTKKIAETNSQIAQAQQTLKYGDLHSPASGTVFELKAGTPGFVATPTEPVLKIVPDEALVAKVSITNKDIGFVKEGMTVDVRIDSFPFSEFGDVKGTLMWIGSDALPPTQIQPYYTFPAKIRLDRQSLMVNGREVRLQSGMSLNANIKVRQRTVMSIFTDQFTRSAESMKFVR